MVIYGLDFTSSPRPGKPLYCIECRLRGETLELKRVHRLPTLSAFEKSLRVSGPWIAGFDFPFGQPRKLIENLGWPTCWDGYVHRIGSMTRPEWRKVLGAYCSARPQRDKYHPRATDVPAGAACAMNPVRPPVALMFYEGAPRLLRAGLSVLPCRPSESDRIAIEAYPALVARRWVGRVSYKQDQRSKQSSDQAATRRTIVNGLSSGECERAYGFRVAMLPGMAESLVEDGTADRLDSLLCAVQAAWAYTRRDCGWGIPRDADSLEGWIADPSLERTPLE
ncbi:MAG: DUF429 domain-containing protein [Armatimonadota bacterium]